MRALPEYAAPSAERFGELSAGGQPFVMRAVADHWPLVQAGRSSPGDALALLASLESGKPADVMLAAPEHGGRFFYGPGLQGYNFTRQRATLAQVGGKLLEMAGQEDEAHAVYAGANETREHMPRFDAAHPLPHATMQRDAKSRVWLCNRAEVATHFDLSDNIAVVALGRRRFTLFPPQATGDLYVGPFNNTLAGQPISMVDPLHPDLERYPRFAQAAGEALSAELSPGDAIFIPTLWWHHVAALDPINVLVNYWYNDVARGGPFLAFIHALSAIRDLPDSQRDGWRAWFDHFIFGPDAKDAAGHLPAGAQGVNGPASAERTETIRQFLVRALS